MKWMIASDLHGSYYYAQQLQQAFEREQADRLLFLADRKLAYDGPPAAFAGFDVPAGAIGTDTGADREGGICCA